MSFNPIGTLIGYSTNRSDAMDSINEEGLKLEKRSELEIALDKRRSVYTPLRDLHICAKKGLESSAQGRGEKVTITSYSGERSATSYWFGGLESEATEEENKIFDEIEKDHNQLSVPEKVRILPYVLFRKLKEKAPLLPVEKLPQKIVAYMGGSSPDWVEHLLPSQLGILGDWLLESEVNMETIIHSRVGAKERKQEDRLNTAFVLASLIHQVPEKSEDGKFCLSAGKKKEWLRSIVRACGEDFSKLVGEMVRDSLGDEVLQSLFRSLFDALSEDPTTWPQARTLLSGVKGKAMIANLDSKRVYSGLFADFSPEQVFAALKLGKGLESKEQHEEFFLFLLPILDLHKNKFNEKLVELISQEPKGDRVTWAYPFLKSLFNEEALPGAEKAISLLLERNYGARSHLAADRPYGDGWRKNWPELISLLKDASPQALERLSSEDMYKLVDLGRKPDKLSLVWKDWQALQDSWYLKLQGVLENWSDSQKIHVEILSWLYGYHGSLAEKRVDFIPFLASWLVSGSEKSVDLVNHLAQQSEITPEEFYEITSDQLNSYLERHPSFVDANPWEVLIKGIGFGEKREERLCACIRSMVTTVREHRLGKGGAVDMDWASRLLSSAVDALMSRDGRHVLEKEIVDWDLADRSLLYGLSQYSDHLPDIAALCMKNRSIELVDGLWSWWSKSGGDSEKRAEVVFLAGLLFLSHGDQKWLDRFLELFPQQEEVFKEIWKVWSSVEQFGPESCAESKESYLKPYEKLVQKFDFDKSIVSAMKGINARVTLGTEQQALVRTVSFVRNLFGLSKEGEVDFQRPTRFDLVKLFANLVVSSKKMKDQSRLERFFDLMIQGDRASKIAPLNHKQIVQFVSDIWAFKEQSEDLKMPFFFAQPVTKEVMASLARTGSPELWKILKELGSCYPYGGSCLVKEQVETMVANLVFLDSSATNPKSREKILAQAIQKKGAMHSELWDRGALLLRVLPLLRVVSTKGLQCEALMNVIHALLSVEGLAVQGVLNQEKYSILKLLKEDYAGQTPARILHDQLMSLGEEYKVFKKEFLSTGEMERSTYPLTRLQIRKKFEETKKLKNGGISSLETFKEVWAELKQVEKMLHHLKGVQESTEDLIIQIDYSLKLMDLLEKKDVQVDFLRQALSIKDPKIVLVKELQEMRESLSSKEKECMETDIGCLKSQIVSSIINRTSYLERARITWTQRLLKSIPGTIKGLQGGEDPRKAVAEFLAWFDEAQNKEGRPLGSLKGMKTFRFNAKRSLDQFLQKQQEQKELENQALVKQLKGEGWKLC